MKHLVLLLALAGFTLSAPAAEPARPAAAQARAGDAPAAPAAPKARRTRTAQQEKMKTCNAQAKGKKGDERRAFMSQCLRAKH